MTAPPPLLANLPALPQLPSLAHTNEDRMPANGKPSGPASYFPSIEKKYGHPIEHWLELARSRQWKW